MTSQAARPAEGPLAARLANALWRPHTLVGVRDPRSLPEAIAQGYRGEPFGLALIDINFGPGVPTGLTAMYR